SERRPHLRHQHRGVGVVGHRAWNAQPRIRSESNNRAVKRRHARPVNSGLTHRGPRGFCAPECFFSGLAVTASKSASLKSFRTGFTASSDNSVRAGGCELIFTARRVAKGLLRKRNQFVEVGMAFTQTAVGVFG